MKWKANTHLCPLRDAKCNGVCGKIKDEEELRRDSINSGWVRTSSSTVSNL